MRAGEVVIAADGFGWYAGRIVEVAGERVTVAAPVYGSSSRELTGERISEHKLGEIMTRGDVERDRDHDEMLIEIAGRRRPPVAVRRLKVTRTRLAALDREEARLAG